jgi:hypothetical protein
MLLPPVKRGDVDAVLGRFPRLASIGMIDGEFFQSFSISPKECLEALDAGKKLYGSSSMGALRATELSVYGMTGIGRIYEMFASGELDADDEVAITFDPHTFSPTSEPLANMRISLAEACEEGRLSREIHDLAIGAAQGMYYPQRTYRNLLTLMKRVLAEDDFRELADCCQAPVNAKQEDAWALLAAMKVTQPKDCASAGVP